MSQVCPGLKANLLLLQGGTFGGKIIIKKKRFGSVSILVITVVNISVHLVNFF